MSSRILLAGMMAGLALGGCTQPSGPVLGEWQGNTPGRDLNVGKDVDLVLDGAPGAQSGTYNIATTEHSALSYSGSGERRWSGSWTRTQRADGERMITVITLKDHLPDDVGAYELAADGMLHALDPNGKPDPNPITKLYALHPVPPRHAR